MYYPIPVMHAHHLLHPTHHPILLLLFKRIFFLLIFMGIIIVSVSGQNSVLGFTTYIFIYITTNSSQTQQTKEPMCWNPTLCCFWSIHIAQSHIKIVWFIKRETTSIHIFTIIFKCLIIIKWAYIYTFSHKNQTYSGIINNDLGSTVIFDMEGFEHIVFP